MRILAHFFDNAAVFPPGNLPLAEALAAHSGHRDGPHGGLVGPLVLAASELPEVASLTEGWNAGSLEVALTVGKPGAVGIALAVADRIPALVMRAVEVAVPAEVLVPAVVPTLDAALGYRLGMEVFVELPRDERRDELVATLSHTAYLAKLRTGGVRADLYPDEAELAAAIANTTRAGVPFKATAGLHHAVRNTDPVTGFEQHGFLNVLTAVAAAQAGADQAEVASVLAERRGPVVAATVAGLGESAQAAREQFRSVGTCSIDEPLTDLARLDLLDDSHLLAARRGSASPDLPEGIPA